MPADQSYFSEIKLEVMVQAEIYCISTVISFTLIPIFNYKMFKKIC